MGHRANQGCFLPSPLNFYHLPITARYVTQNEMNKSSYEVTKEIENICNNLLNFLKKTQWFLYMPPDLTFTNSAICQLSVFMCFVWILNRGALRGNFLSDFLILQ
jgi:hypothetical protein